MGSNNCPGNRDMIRVGTEIDTVIPEATLKFLLSNDSFYWKTM